VGETAFATPAAGWAMVGAPAVCRLLYTEDAGATWTPQLAWQGAPIGRLTAFDACRAGLVLGLTPEANDVNGYPVGGGDYAAVFASTEDAGTTWTVGSAPDPKAFTGMFHFLTPRRLWLLTAPIGHYPRTDVARTEDGGATWTKNGSPENLPFTQVAFSTVTDGLLIAAEGFRNDILYVTGDGGTTWTRQPLAPPPGLPATAETLLSPVIRSGDPVLLLRAYSRRQSTPRWAGSYAYLGTDRGQTWSGPHRLPMAPSWTQPDLAVPGRDGRFWAASGHDIWVADDLGGPWRHQPAQLPADQLIANIAPVGDGVLWLTTTRYPSPGTPPSGMLYRSEDDGEHWARLAVTPLTGEPIKGTGAQPSSH